MIMKYSILLLFIFISVLANTQSANIDSLWNVWKNEQLPDHSRFNALSKLIWNVYLPNQPDSAFYYSNQLLKNVREKKDVIWEAKVLSLQGIYHAKKSNYEEAIKVFERSVSLQLQENLNCGATYSNIGNCYMDLSDYVTALEYFQKAQIIFTKHNDEESYSRANYHIARILTVSGNYQQAEIIFLEVAELNKKNNDYIKLAHSYTGLGEVKIKLKEYKAAISYFTDALNLFIQYNDKYGQAFIYKLLGEVSYKENKWKETQRYLETSLNIYNELDHKKGIAASYIQLGKLSLQDLQFQQAINYCTKGLKLAELVDILKEKKEACQCLYQTYKKQNNTPMALQYFEVLSQTQDSLFSSEQAKKITALQLKYSHQREKEKLENDKKLKDITIANQRKVIGLISFLLIILALGGGIIYNQKNKLSAAYKVLVQKSREIVQQEKELKKVSIPQIKASSIPPSLYQKDAFADLQSKISTYN